MSEALILTGEALASAFAALAALDAMGRNARMLSFGGPLPEVPRRLSRILALVPAREEGEAAVAAVRSLLVERASGSGPALDVLLLLDGDDPAARRALEGTGAEVLVKDAPGPHKGAALAWAARTLGARLDAWDFILVFDVDSRPAPGFLAALQVPSGTEAFQLPVRPEPPRDGAARVAAFSTALARHDDLARDARGLPVRLRGKGMGFTPRAFREGPGSADRTTVEDSEATLRLYAAGTPVRALAGPAVLEEGAGDPARSRARWYGGHLRLLARGARDFARIAARRPWDAFVLGCDLWLRPRVLVLAGVLGLGLVSALHLALAGPDPRAETLVLFVLSGSTLALEGATVALARRRVEGAALPSWRDVRDALLLWGKALARGAGAPATWHRSRAPRDGR